MHTTLVLLLDCLLGSMMAAVLATLRENNVRSMLACWISMLVTGLSHNLNTVNLHIFFSSFSCLLPSDIQVNSDIDIA